MYILIRGEYLCICQASVWEVFGKKSPTFGFSWLLQPEPEPFENNVVLVIVLDPEIRRLVKIKDFISLKKLLYTKLHIDDSTILQLVKNTTGQTKILYGFIIGNIDLQLVILEKYYLLIKEISSQSLFKLLENNNNITGVQWGNTNEICGIKVLEHLKM